MSMSDLISSELEAEIRYLMSAPAQLDVNGKEKYWYPLAVAHYGPDEVLGALDSLLSYRTTMWEKTRQFELAFSKKLGGQAVMVNSGSSADLLIAFSMLEQSGGPLNHGDEVLAPAVTWPTQVWSLLMAGFKVRLVDVDPETLNVSPETLSRSIGPKTRAISLVHLMGNPVDMDAVSALCSEHKLVLMEDCCESLGAQWRGQPVGTFGRAASFSFFFSHHITTMEGGMIVTGDPKVAEELRLLRAHGWSRNLLNPPDASPGIDPRYTFLNWGFNVRPTELQAAFGLAQLAKVDEFQEERDRNIGLVKDWLEQSSMPLQLMVVSPHAKVAWFAIPLMVTEGGHSERDRLMSYLDDAGIETRPIVTGNIARHPAAARFGSRLSWGDLPGAEKVHESGFYLGLHPLNSKEKLQRVFEVLDLFDW